VKTILVSMLQEHGHLNPSFKVSRTLKARGYDVKYFGILDFKAYIESQGFECVPFLPGLYPRGFIEAEDQHQRGRLEARRAITVRYKLETEWLLAPTGLRTTLERLRPQLMIVDVNHTTRAYLAHQLRIPVVAMNVTLPQTKDAGVPPIRSGLGYRAGLCGRIRAELAWQSFLVKRRLLVLTAGRVGMCPPYELARRAASRFGYPIDRVDTATVFMPQLIRTPELILCPDGFDFPRPRLPERHYVESIDLARTEPDFPWHRIDSSKPLIYVSMGSMRHQLQRVRRLTEIMIDALGARPAWQGVVALGRYLGPHELTHCPDNVVAITSAPQLAILKRAMVMVTHGGLGSVKECVLHGVPMIVFPLAVDQPGNAARVEHHELGLRGDWRNVSRAGILALIDRVVGDPRYAARVSDMRTRFEATERGTAGADAVEETLAKRTRVPSTA
jgi:zeaxanthin glucosyltransferase